MATTNKDLNTPAYDSPNWDVPLNANFEIIDAALGDTTSISVAGVPATPVVLTATQYQAMSLSFSGLLGNNVTYQIPSGVGGTWSVFNATTGSFTLTIDNVAVGTSVVVPQGQSRILVSDGTNIKVAGNAGAANQVLYNDGTGPVGDADFTFVSDVLSFPRARTADGTTLLPAISPTTDTDTGIWFPAVGEIAVSTAGVRRMGLNGSGAIGLGTTPDYGDAGEVLKSAGNAAQAVWGLAGATAIANQAASGTTVTFSGLNLSLYKFVVVVIADVSHNSGSNRSLSFGSLDLGPSAASTVDLYGMIVLHPASQACFSVIGGSAGGSSTSTAGLTTYGTASTSVVLSLSGSGSFDGGNFFLLGIS